MYGVLRVARQSAHDAAKTRAYDECIRTLTRLEDVVGRHVKCEFVWNWMA